MLQLVVSYVGELIGQAVRLACVVLFATLLNLMLFSVNTVSLAMFRDTGMVGQFSSMHPALYDTLSSLVELTPYWQSSLQLAVAAVCGALGVAVLMQLSGLRRLLFEPLPLPLKGLWAVLIALLLAVPVAHYDGRLAYLEYVWLLLPTMLCVLIPVVGASSRIVPDMTEFVA